MKYISLISISCLLSSLACASDPFENDLFDVKKTQFVSVIGLPQGTDTYCTLTK